MIISASRRTDLPAFYGDWFTRRIKAGFLSVQNPMNHRQVRRVELSPEAVDCIVFWTKNAAPFFKYLPLLDNEGYQYYFQFTLNPYPPEIEGRLPALKKRIETFQRLADQIGPERVVWRYDPILFSSQINLEWHLDQCRAIAHALHGYTKRCVFSFVDFYKKTVRNTQHLGVIPITAKQMETMGRHLAEMGRAHDLVLTTCCESVDLEPYGIAKGACIDPELINAIAGTNATFRPDPFQRQGCGCVQSIDIGAYNTCVYQCAYCYANVNARTALQNLRRHDPSSDMMLGDE